MNRRKQMKINAPVKYQQTNSKGYNKKTAIAPNRIWKNVRATTKRAAIVRQRVKRRKVSSLSNVRARMLMIQKRILVTGTALSDATATAVHAPSQGTQLYLKWEKTQVSWQLHPLCSKQTAVSRLAEEEERDPRNAAAATAAMTVAATVASHAVAAVTAVSRAAAVAVTIVVAHAAATVAIAAPAAATAAVRSHRLRPKYQMQWTHLSLVHTRSHSIIKNGNSSEPMSLPA